MEQVRESLEQLGLDLGSGAVVVDAGRGEPRLDPRRDTLVLRAGRALAALAEQAARRYPAGHRLRVLRPGAAPLHVPADGLAEAGPWAEDDALLVPAARGRADCEDLRELMARLLGESGCPWDREQDHRSLRGSLLEEAYEVIHAIDADDAGALAGELGDLLLQVLFHAQLAEQAGRFTLDDVTARLHEKLVARHPHVFGDAVARDAQAVLRRWDAIKAAEAGESAGWTVSSVPRILPALMRAAAVQRRAARVGFDWPDLAGPLAKLHEEIAELAEAGADPVRAEEELGDLLFAVVNVARFLKVDPEQALRAAVDRFVERFEAMRRRVEADGKRLDAMSLDEMDHYWEAAKQSEQ
jgi:tetrapyrrole methylase family protein/MazG family protein